jgi:hypothetical protein
VYSPGSAGWLEKYFDLIERSQISLNIDFSIDDFNVYRDTGLIYGISIKKIFTPESYTKNWTSHDHLKALFFESLLLVYLKKNKGEFNKEKFVDSLDKYYRKEKVKSSFDFFSYLKKKSILENIELAINDRLELDKRMIETRIWLTSLNNALVFLDTILFEEFLFYGKSKSYQDLSKIIIQSFMGAAKSDKEIYDSDRKSFGFYLACARLDEKSESDFESDFENTEFYFDSSNLNVENQLFKKYILWFSCFIVSINRQVSKEEREYLEGLTEALSFAREELDFTFSYTLAFVVQNSNSISYLGASSTDILLSNLSKRWGKILLRNKDKLVQEIQQSKELMLLLGKSTQKELSKEEKELVKTQLIDIMKTMPSLAIFLIPGGSLLLPIFLKFVPGLLPSAFQDNKVSKDT